MSTNLLTDLRRSFTRRTDGKIKLDDLRDVMGERAFGVLLLLSVLPTLVPVPLSGLILGLPLFIIGLQMVLGLRMPWLPRFLLRHEFPQKPLLELLDVLELWWHHLQTWSRPRQAFLVEGSGEKVAGLVVVILWVPVMAPLPLTNILPAFPLILLALALTNRDGLLALVAYALGVVVMGILALIYGGLGFGIYAAWKAWL